MQKDSHDLMRNEMISVIKWYKMKSYEWTWSSNILAEICRSQLIYEISKGITKKKAEKVSYDLFYFLHSLYPEELSFL